MNLNEDGSQVDEPVTYGAFIKIKHVQGGKNGGITWTTHPMTRAFLLGVRAQLQRALEYVEQLLLGVES